MKVTKRKRVVNPGRRNLRSMTVTRVVKKYKNPRKKKMTAKQIRFFGTKRQKAALKRKRVISNPRYRGKGYKSKSDINRKVRRSIKSQGTRILGLKAKTGGRKSAKAKYYAEFSTSRRKRRSNPASIVSLSLPVLGMNPGRKRRKVRRSKSRVSNSLFSFLKGTNKKTMARKRARRKNPLYYRGKANTPKARGYLQRKKGVFVYSSNPRRRRKYTNSGRRRSVMSYRRRRRNPSVRGFISSRPVTTVVGFLGGSAATHMIMQFVPAQFSTGLIGLAASAIVAGLQAKFLGPLASKVVGTNLTPAMQTGGWVYVGLRAVDHFFPGLAANFGIRGINGMGILTRSSFYTPQVNLPNSMNQFYTPAAVTNAIASAIPAGGINGLNNAQALTKMSLV